MGLREQDVLLVVGTSGEVVPIANWLKTLNIPAKKMVVQFGTSIQTARTFV
jgi:NAD-dependent SIR2 family protein deacetylase